MARSLDFQFGDLLYSLEIQKIDRGKLYGTKEVEAVDENEELCELATLADDGRTLIGRGGTGLGWLDVDGKWCDKSELEPHNMVGDLVQSVPSSFNAPIKLFDTASAEDYLAHNIRLIYRLYFHGPSEKSDSARDLSELIAELDRGTIFKFPYSYRGGLEADVAFVLLNEDSELMMVVGNPTEVSFVGIQSLALHSEATEIESEEELMDFDMI